MDTNGTITSFKECLQIKEGCFRVAVASVENLGSHRLTFNTTFFQLVCKLDGERGKLYSSYMFLSTGGTFLGWESVESSDCGACYVYRTIRENGSFQEPHASRSASILRWERPQMADLDTHCTREW